MNGYFRPISPTEQFQSAIPAVGPSPEDRIRALAGRTPRPPQFSLDMPPEQFGLQVPSMEDLGAEIAPPSPLEMQRQQLKDAYQQARKDRRTAYEQGIADRRSAYEARQGSQRMPASMVASEFKR